MGAMLQALYLSWCRRHAFWVVDLSLGEVLELAAAGFTVLWPPPNNAAVKQ